VIEYCPKIKVLITSRKALRALAYNEEYCYPLNPISKESTIKLLFMKAARQIKASEIEELLNCQIFEDGRVSQLLPHYIGTPQLINHPFINLLGGHPQAISLTAPLLKHSSLKELFLRFRENKLIDVVHDDCPIKNATTSLRVSLEMSIESIQKTCPDSLNLFSLIGMLPSGINKEEITQVWGNKEWIKLKDTLVRSSLLIHKNMLEESDIYYMLPFMSERACEMLNSNHQLRRDYHLKCCTLYKNY